MTLFVLDNSVCARWLFGDGDVKDITYARAVLDRMASGDAGAIVPGIWGLELANVMARGEAKGLLTADRIQDFLRIIRHMDIREDPNGILHSLHQILPLARKYSLSAYDSAYLELAIRLGSPLATLDHDLRKTLTKVGVTLF